MRHGVGCEMESRACEKGSESRPGRSAGDSADGDMERHDHADIRTCAERSTAMGFFKANEQYSHLEVAWKWRRPRRDEG
jgi:hypothetical protein